jgi:general secretion pathway protein A
MRRRRAGSKDPEPSRGEFVEGCFRDLLFVGFAAYPGDPVIPSKKGKNMYEAFYGLREKPFNLSPDPDFLYMSRGHENACVHLRYAVRENKGFVVVTGEAGSGKTTLINYLLQTLLKNAVVGLVNHTSLMPEPFLRAVCDEFELEAERPDKAAMLKVLHEFLVAHYGKWRRVVLIVDEAQNLPMKTLEEIRMLSNLEAEKVPLLQIILAGQPELQALLGRPELRQFTQRVAVACHLGPLEEAEVKAYVVHRLKVAGAEKGDLFDDEAIKAVAAYSGGIPRLINLVCDSALVVGYADGEKRIGKKTVEEALGLRKLKEDFKHFNEPQGVERRSSAGSATTGWSPSPSWSRWGHGE